MFTNEIKYIIMINMTEHDVLRGIDFCNISLRGYGILLFLYLY